MLKIKGGVDDVFSGQGLRALEKEVLPGYLAQCRWFAGKSEAVRSIRIVDLCKVGDGGARLAVVKVDYDQGSTEKYFLPLCFKYLKDDPYFTRDFPQGIICLVNADSYEGMLVDATYDQQFRDLLFTLISGRRQIVRQASSLKGYPGGRIKAFGTGERPVPASNVLKADQSNTAILYGKLYFMKLFRRFEVGLNPDVEIVRYLSDVLRYDHVPQFAGHIEYGYLKSRPACLCSLQSYVENQSDCWSLTTSQLKIFFGQELKRLKNDNKADPDALIDPVFVRLVRLMALRTAEMHRKLSSDTGSAAFKAEKFSYTYQKSLYKEMCARAKCAWQALQRQLVNLPAGIRDEAAHLLNERKKAGAIFHSVLEIKFSGKKIRVHGDYHLGQVLFTGSDFVIIDFEGEPDRSLKERRAKSSVLRDVAGLVRSLHYAAYSTLLFNDNFSQEDVQRLSVVAERWYTYISSVFLSSYLDGAFPAPFLPSDQHEVQALLRIYLLDKAVYELNYELNNRPAWTAIPLKGINNLLQESVAII